MGENRLNISNDCRIAVFGTSGFGKSVFTNHIFRNTSPLFIHNPQEEYFSDCKNYFSFSELRDAYNQTIKWNRNKKQKIPHRYALVTENLGEIEKLSNLCWLKKNCTLLLDEVYRVVRKGKTPESVTLIARRGRKRNVRLVLTNQRAAYTDFEVLSQCNHIFVFRIVFPVDIEYLVDLIPGFKEMNVQLRDFRYVYFSPLELHPMLKPALKNPIKEKMSMTDEEYEEYKKKKN